MSELELRANSLEQALRTASVGERPDDVLDRARDYYRFLSGKSPDHRPPPADLKTAG